MMLLAYNRGLVSIQTPFIHGSMAAVGMGYKSVIRLVVFAHYNKTSDSPRLLLDTKCLFTILCMLNLFVLTFLLHPLSIKKTHQKPLYSFKDLGIHMDRQQEAILFHTMFMMCYDAGLYPLATKRGLKLG
jgi:hypothetical protein